MSSDRQPTQEPADGQDAHTPGAIQSADPRRECLNCGAAIDARVSKVVGDNNGNVPACKRCFAGRSGRDAVKTTASAVRLCRRRETGLTAAREGGR